MPSDSEHLLLPLDVASLLVSRGLEFLGQLLASHNWTLNL